MACVAVDTNFPDSEQAVRLGELLGERLAWCHAIRLWSWGIDQDREDGTLRLESKRIAEIASYRGDPDKFVAALIEVGLLVQRHDGSLYMSGWSRNKEFFSKKRRMRRYRDKQKSQQATPPETPIVTPQVTSRVTSKETHSPSPSPSPSHIDTSHRAPQSEGAAEKLSGAFGKLLSSAEQLRLKGIEPRPTPDEIDKAICETKANANKPCISYALTVLESSRKPKPKISSPPRDPRVGYHPGSKPEEFVDGIVDLNKL